MADLLGGVPRPVRASPLIPACAMGINPLTPILVYEGCSDRVLRSSLNELGGDSANLRLASIESRNLVWQVVKVVHIESPSEQS